MNNIQPLKNLVSINGLDWSIELGENGLISWIGEHANTIRAVYCEACRAAKVEQNRTSLYAFIKEVVKPNYKSGLVFLFNK